MQLRLKIKWEKHLFLVQLQGVLLLEFTNNLLICVKISNYLSKMWSHSTWMNTILLGKKILKDITFTCIITFSSIQIFLQKILIFPVVKFPDNKLLHIVKITRKKLLAMEESIFKFQVSAELAISALTNLLLQRKVSQDQFIFTGSPEKMQQVVLEEYKMFPNAQLQWVSKQSVRLKESLLWLGLRVNQKL